MNFIPFIIFVLFVIFLSFFLIFCSELLRSKSKNKRPRSNILKKQFNVIDAKFYNSVAIAMIICVEAALLLPLGFKLKYIISNYETLLNLILFFVSIVIICHIFIFILYGRKASSFRDRM